MKYTIIIIMYLLHKTGLCMNSINMYIYNLSHGYIILFLHGHHVGIQLMGNVVPVTVTLFSRAWNITSSFPIIVHE